MATAELRQSLRPWVRSIQHYDIAGFPPGEHIGLPSSAVTLVIPLDPQLELSMPGAGRRRMDSCLAGLHDGPVTIHHDGTQRGVQVALTPLGLHDLFGVTAGSIAHQAVGLADVLGHRAADILLDRIASEPTWAARVRLVQTELARRLAAVDGRGRRMRPELARVWSVLRASGGTARISDVADEVGWSARHLSQQFAGAVGFGPKVAARLMRFERSVTRVGAGDALADVAASCGYADQAHLTREWTRLAGTTPARWPRVDVLANVQEARAGSARGSLA